MKTSHRIAVTLVALGSLVAIGTLATADDNPPPSHPQSGSQPTTGAMTPDAKATLDDVQQTLGFVPEFLRKMPPEMLPGVWSEMKMLQMNTMTKLDGKTKELIGLAVASQIPCQYCIYFHTVAAQSHGASEQEVREAVGMGALTREVSTILNGLQIDPQQFRRDTDRMLHNARPQTSRK